MSTAVGRNVRQTAAKSGTIWTPPPPPTIQRNPCKSVLLGGFITGSDFLMDGGVTAAYWHGELDEVRRSSP